jgi:hypothetical protein
MFNNADISYFISNFTRHFMHMRKWRAFLMPRHQDLITNIQYPPRPSQREGEKKEGGEKKGWRKKKEKEKEGKGEGKGEGEGREGLYDWKE